MALAQVTRRGEPSGGRRARIRSAGAALLIGSVIVVGAELGLRLLGVAEDWPERRLHGFSSRDPVFVRRPGSDARSVWEQTVRGGREPPPSFTAEAPADLFRVFAMGGSSTAGVPYGRSYAFPAWLERELEASLPDVPIEVVNTGVPGYGTRRLVLVARAIAEHAPDLVVVYTGHNEGAERRFYASLLDRDPRLFRILDWVTHTRLHALLARALRRDRTELEIDLGPAHDLNQMFSSQAQDWTAAELRYRDLFFERNLEEIVTTLQAAGSRVLLLTLSQNFADHPPGASARRPGLGPDELSEWTGHVERGRAHRARGDCARALAHYQKALAIDDRHAQLHYEVADCHRRRGETQPAAFHYRLASDLDRVPHGAPTHFNETIRRIASRRGTLWVDAAGILEAEASEGLVGNGLFVDAMHPNLRAHQRIARAVAGELRRNGLPLPEARWMGTYDAPDPEALYAREPALRTREIESQIVTCVLAQRQECVEARARELLERDPESAIARSVLQLQPER